MKKRIGIAVILIGLAACSSDDEMPPANSPECAHSLDLQSWQSRNFKMGFTTWPYGPEISDIDSTHAFIARNGDLYTEHLDNKIPWDALINGSALPQEFSDDLAYRVAKRHINLELLLSVSLLNSTRSDLMGDFDGSTPAYTALNDQHIEDAYFDHLTNLVNALNPDYLVLAIEANQLLIHSIEKWNQYKMLMENIRFRIRQAFPALPISESVTLHDWQFPEAGSASNYIQEITDYCSNFDFAAISFYPFLENFQTKSEIQSAFNFLHSHASKPIAFVETGSISEDLNLPTLGISIPGTRCGQQEYLEILLQNAQDHNYIFTVWWTFADYDKLYAIFPPEAQLLGSVWLNNGLIDENGQAKPACSSWRNAFEVDM